MDVTEQVLGQIGAADKPVIVAYNKADLLVDGRGPDGTPFLPARAGILLSAKTGEGAKELMEAILAALYQDRKTVTLCIPYARGDVLSYVCEEGVVLSMEHQEEGTVVKVELSGKDYDRVAAYDTL